jgi:hypothetical protein
MSARADRLAFPIRGMLNDLVLRAVDDVACDLPIPTLGEKESFVRVFQRIS